MPHKRSMARPSKSARRRNDSLTARRRGGSLCENDFSTDLLGGLSITCLPKHYLKDTNAWIYPTEN
jgi:hypothetical protein